MTTPTSQMPIARVLGVTLDVVDLELEKKFWGAALGVDIKSEVPGWASFQVMPGFGLELQRVPEEKAVKNRAHFDLRIAAGKAGIRRLEELGASIVEHHEYEVGEWYVMADPEGNEFCAVTRHQNFEPYEAE